MKKLILTLTASLACVAAFAQGKISFQTDNNHLVYFDPSVGGAVGGHLATSANSPVPLLVDLYMGTSATALSLYSSTTLNPASNPGKWGAVSVAANANGTTGAPALAGGTVVWVETQIRDSSVAAANTLDGTATGAAYAQSRGFSYYGYSQEFQFTLGSSVTYPPMYNAPGWTAGTFDTSGEIAGSHGAIAIFSVPEPGSVALMGLALAGMAIFRRRK